MSHKSSDQAFQSYINKLGEERGRFVKALENDLYNLRIHFEIYTAFFGTNKERIDLFNSVSGNSAYWIERAMFESLVLNVCRLTDPIEMNGGKRNVTVKALPSQLTNGPDSELEGRVAAAADASSFARDWRNRRIAHTDAQVRLGRAKLDTATRARLSEAIDAIAACIRRYALVELNTTLGTHPIRQLGNDELDFLAALHFGRVEQTRREEIRIDLISKREWAQIDELEKLPAWLTFRPEQKDDLE